MRTILLLAGFLLINIVGLAQTKWVESTWQDAFAQAQKENKYLFIDCYTDWCGWCKRLQAEAFYKPEFEKWAKENVVLMELDFPRRTPIAEETREQNMNLQRMFGVRGYPTIWFVNPKKNGTEINFEKIGQTGYVAGGANAWIAEANRIMSVQP